MIYETRRLLAITEVRVNQTRVDSGEVFECTPRDAEYLISRRKAMLVPEARKDDKPVSVPAARVPSPSPEVEFSEREAIDRRNAEAAADLVRKEQEEKEKEKAAAAAEANLKAVVGGETVSAAPADVQATVPRTPRAVRNRAPVTSTESVSDGTNNS